MSQDTEGERICRYCFEGEEEGTLISPCKCSGGQKYVHLACLRRWQRGVLVSQPTHPAFYEDDKRHHVCNVCLSEYTCPPPSRGELMESFTGPELAALLEVGCIIASHDQFTAHLKSQLETIPEFLWDRLSYCHWIDGAYLITKVEPDEGIVRIPIASQRLLDNIRRRLSEDLSISMRGRKLRVAAAASLAGVSEDDLPQALADLTAPVEIVLKAVQQAGCSEDHIAAVNLTRPAAEPPVPEIVSAAVAAVPGADQIELRHFLGGPCEEEDVACCIVLGGSGCGWTVVDDLKEAIALAKARVAPGPEAQGSFACGQAVRLSGLKAAQHLNGELGLTLRFDQSTGRWQVRLQNGEGKCVKPGNLEAAPGAENGVPQTDRGLVMVFWGDAQWSRAQLLGEIARGSWGMCRAGVSELLVKAGERRRGLDGRLAFAPITEMSDDYIRDAQSQMELLRGQAQAQGASQSHGGDDAVDGRASDDGVTSRPVEDQLQAETAAEYPVRHEGLEANDGTEHQAAVEDFPARDISQAVNRQVGEAPSECGGGQDPESARKTDGSDMPNIQSHPLSAISSDAESDD